MKLLSILMPCSDALQRIIHEFTHADLQVTRSFDLQSARELLIDPSDCTCAYHGTDHCTCQYVVLLISHMSKPPATLVVHGHDDWTHLSLVQQDGNLSEDDETVMHIREALIHLEQIILDSTL